DMFNVLPWRREIIESLLACDDVGFHIPRYASNFVSVARSLFDVDVSERVRAPEGWISEGSALTERILPSVINYAERDVAVSVTPVGVDTAYIEERSRAPETLSQAQEIRAELGDARLILSVGRTDYTKGGIDQLTSFERVLENNPELIGKLRLMHVSVSANKNMTVYADIQSEIEALAGRINGRFGRLDWQPVTLISRAVPFERLVAFYQVADVAWITPLADGMNLVCKEFVASRLDDDGVLILSEFAGAAVELHQAVIVNPFSHRSMDQALLQALDMPQEERQTRMKGLRAAVRMSDIRGWAPGTLKIAPDREASQLTNIDTAAE
ncbi:MAG: trehalose-6-phosphate synthase, partial [Pseudomonadota bacterium]